MRNNLIVYFVGVKNSVLIAYLVGCLFVVNPAFAQTTTTTTTETAWTVGLSVRFFVDQNDPTAASIVGVWIKGTVHVLTYALGPWLSTHGITNDWLVSPGITVQDRNGNVLNSDANGDPATAAWNFDPYENGAIDPSYTAGMHYYLAQCGFGDLQPAAAPVNDNGLIIGDVMNQNVAQDFILDSGGYTTLVWTGTTLGTPNMPPGTNAGSGVVLAGWSRLDQGGSTLNKIVDISGRAKCSKSGYRQLIAGIETAGTGTKRYLVVMGSQTLAVNGGVTDLAPNVTLEFHSFQNGLIATNTGWDQGVTVAPGAAQGGIEVRSATQDDFVAVSSPQTVSPGSNDSAMVVTVPAPGGYTVLGYGTADGNAIAEVFELPDLPAPQVLTARFDDSAAQRGLSIGMFASLLSTTEEIKIVS